MPSRNELIAAHDFRPTGGTSGEWETIIRRIGGSPERAEDVLAVVDFGTDGGGMVTDGNGKLIEVAGRLEVLAGQAVKDTDDWVVDGSVYRTVGLPTSFDGATKTVNLVQRIGRIAAKPRTRGR
jgi:hypothetical protein